MNMNLKSTVLGHMGTSIKTLAAGGIAMAALMFSSVSSAAPIICESVQDERYMTLDSIVGGPSTCHSAGLGNESDPFAGQPLLWKIELDPAGSEGPGPNPFISFTGTGGNLTSGSFELIEGLLDHYLVFKFGNGGGDPDWFAYAINGMTVGEWAFFANDPNWVNGLSHVGIYGPAAAVPEPSTVMLLAGCLMAFVGLRRRRHTLLG